MRHEAWCVYPTAVLSSSQMNVMLQLPRGRCNLLALIANSSIPLKIAKW
jgi:hypothetical protein